MRKGLQPIIISPSTFLCLVTYDSIHPELSAKISFSTMEGLLQS